MASLYFVFRCLVVALFAAAYLAPSFVVAVCFVIALLVGLLASVACLVGLFLVVA